MRAASCLALCLVAETAWGAGGPLKLWVDATDAPRRVLHARLGVPTAPGPLTLRYPKWIPGEHGPNGPVVDLVSLRFTAGGKPLAWRRDDADMTAFHLTVPAGASEVEATYDFLLPGEAQGFSSGASSTPQLLLLSWNQVLLYPSGAASDAVTFQASLRLPEGWQAATALTPAGKISTHQEKILHFEPVSLTQLVDSPVLTGAQFKRVDLGPDHALNLAADTREALALDGATEAAFKALVRETGALFGSRHYAHYDFLLTLSDHVAHFGLEHHQSSDNRIPERALVDAAKRPLHAGLLPHEMVHSWNGKFRRPQGLATGNYHDPMKGELLWVYEGLTQYLGNILTARSGLRTPELYREGLALTAAEMDTQAGRGWRPLVDTAVAAQILYASTPAGGSVRRGVDFYPEGDLIWLEVDATLRQRSEGKVSLDDFCKAFHGGPGGKAEVKPYTYAEVVALLERLSPGGWDAFFQNRVMSVASRPPLEGLALGGWKLAYGDTPGTLFALREEEEKVTERRFDLGATLKVAGGMVMDVVPGSPAAAAGLAAGMKVLGVNGRMFTPEAMKEAIQAKTGLSLLVENQGFYQTLAVTYAGGLRYPRLERLEGTPDRLSDIIRPLARP